MAKHYLKMKAYKAYAEMAGLDVKEELLQSENNFEHEIAKFKQNQNKMKTMLIEENRKQKELVISIIQSSRLELEKRITDFHTMMEKLYDKIDAKMYELHNEAMTKIEDCVKKENVTAMCESISKKVEKKYEYLLSARLTMEKEAELEMKLEFDKERQAAKNQRKVYRENLRKLYQDEKNIVIKTINAANKFQDASVRVTERLEDQVDGMITQKVTQTVYRETNMLRNHIASILRQVKGLALPSFEEQQKESDKLSHFLMVGPSKTEHMPVPLSLPDFQNCLVLT